MKRHQHSRGNREGALERRNMTFQGHCDKFASARAVALFEESGVVYAERDGARWPVHRAIDQRIIWCETWRLLHDDPSVLLPPVAGSSRP